MSSTPYFTSRQRSNFTRPTPNYQAASQGNQNELLRSLNGLNARLSQIETRNGGSSISLKTGSPVISAPPLADMSVSASGGTFRLSITNPQFKVSGRGNLPNTPMYHKILFSPTQDFSSSTQLPITNQTYLEVSQFGPSRQYVSFSSSFDGQNYNESQILGPFQS